MELREALSQIAEIRRQMARSEVFRGYRAAPVAFTGVLAWTAAVAQSAWIPEPTQQVSAYLTLWIGAAAVGLVASGLEMVTRARRSTPWSRGLTRQAAEQFAPCLVAGGLTTLVLGRCAEEVIWALPGLWSIFFGLGIFASGRLLPRATYGVASYYLATGLGCLALARGEFALSPWAMGVPFGGGQLLAAAVLYRTLECDHGHPS